MLTDPSREKHAVHRISDLLHYGYFIREDLLYLAGGLKQQTIHHTRSAKHKSRPPKVPLSILVTNGRFSCYARLFFLLQRLYDRM